MNYDKRLQLIISLLVSTVLFMEFLDVSIINTAVPTIARDFGVSPIILKFSVASYFLSLAIFIPISGWCTDKFGTKTMFILSVGLFTLASFSCANSHSAVELTFFRFLQGVGGAFMNPVSRIIILRIFPPKDLVRIQGMIFTPALLGTVLGPFLGGIITQYLTWHWIFLINIPVGIIALWVGYKFIEQFKLPVKSFDWVGFAIVAIGLLAVTFCLEMLDHYDIVSKTVVMLSGCFGVSLVIVATIYCLNKKYALFDFSIFKINAFNVAFSTNIVFFMTHSAVMFMLPLMYQECFSYSPAQSGYLVLPIAMASMIARSVANTMIEKFGFNHMLKLGALLITMCLLLMSLFDIGGSIYYILGIEFIYGYAVIMAGSANGALCYVNTPPQQISNATSFDLTFRQFFSSIGIGLGAFCLVNFSMLLDVKIFTVAGVKVFHYTFFVLAIFGFIAFLNTFRLKKVIV